MKDIFTPHRLIADSTARVIAAVWVSIFASAWILNPSAVLPTPVGVLTAYRHLWENGFLANLLSSLWLNLEAIALSSIISLLVSYLVVIPALRYPIVLLAKLRFLGLTGLTFVFGLIVSGHNLKLGLLVFGMSVFLITSLVSMVSSIPQERLDHARALGMSDWHIVWEVVILGTIGEAIELIRQNAAIGWMMLAVVEGLVRSEGGVGVMLLNENKHFNLNAVFALQIVILGIGLLQDYMIVRARSLLCPYSDLRMVKS